jgi:DNA recombination protein RmuC
MAAGGLAMAEWLAGYGAMVGAGVVAAAVLGAAFVVARSSSKGREQAALLAARLEALALAQDRGERVLREELALGRRELAGQTHHLREEVGGSLRAVGETVEKRIEVLRGAVDLRLGQIQQETQKRLDEMRATVDEKLQGTLEQRLGAAFAQVSVRLEAVHKGLGEMQTLAVGVGNLERVLSNVRARGSFGEQRLEALLEDTLTSDQWERQVATRPGSSERVDVAVRMPGGDDGAGHPLWLPIDAKFPHDDYERLLDAHERGDAAAAEEAGRALEARLKAEARAIRDKYVCPPHTTHFALLFLPTESLYAEVLRRPGLFDVLRREYAVTLAGPTTLVAILGSLQMGFRSLAVTKRSQEIFQLLGAVKTQFGKFGDLLAGVQRKLDEASNKIGEASQKSRYIERRLGQVQELPAAEAAALLPAESDAES